MPQMWIPIIPSEATAINGTVSVSRNNGMCIYFCGINPMFFHSESDLRSFRMFTSQLVCQGMCKQAEIVRAFGVSKNSVNRGVNKYREGGAKMFFAPRKGRGGSVLNDAVKARAQELLNLGKTKKEIAEDLNIKYDTLRKAVSQGRLYEPPRELQTIGSDKSTRTVEDRSAEMGTACTRPLERVAAALGLLPGGAPIRFNSCRDVSFGGILCAIPALITSGLLNHVDKCFKDLKGYYTTLQILLLVAYMALCRIKTV
ncbi:hypothetical protein K8T06_16285, partial [bacterium]|nr:hypothetical protein [bacterium]